MCSAQRGQKVFDPLGLELQMFGELIMWVLGIEPRYFGVALSAF